MNELSLFGPHYDVSDGVSRAKRLFGREATLPELMAAPAGIWVSLAPGANQDDVRIVIELAKTELVKKGAEGILAELVQFEAAERQRREKEKRRLENAQIYAALSARRRRAGRRAFHRLRKIPKPVGGKMSIKSANRRPSDMEWVGRTHIR